MKFKKILFGFMVLVYVGINTSNVFAITNDEGAKWAENRIGQSIDYDGWYGAQCMDFIVKFAVDNFGWRPSGNAIDLITIPIPPGWQRIKDTPDFVPRRGDIAIWTSGIHKFGHSSIIISANQHGFVSVDQIWINSSDNGNPAARVNHNYNHFWGVLRPPYDINTNSQPTPNGMVWEKGIFYPNQTINIRNAPNRQATIVGKYTKGEYVVYDGKIISDGHVWISYKSLSTGERRYMAVRTYNNGVRGELWGTIK